MYVTWYAPRPGQIFFDRSNSGHPSKRFLANSHVPGQIWTTSFLLSHQLFAFLTIFIRSDIKMFWYSKFIGDFCIQKSTSIHAKYAKIEYYWIKLPSTFCGCFGQMGYPAQIFAPWAPFFVEFPQVAWGGVSSWNWLRH